MKFAQTTGAGASGVRRPGMEIGHQVDTKPGFLGHQTGHQGGKLLRTKRMVPKKGLEPPHPCGYMDLNHARLPIPPLRQVTACGAAKAALMEETATSILQVERGVSNQQPRNIDYEDMEGEWRARLVPKRQKKEEPQKMRVRDREQKSTKKMRSRDCASLRTT